MKRVSVFLIIIYSLSALAAQVIPTGSFNHYKDASGVDHLVVFDRIDNSSVTDATELHYRAKKAGSFVQWFIVTPDGNSTAIYDVNSLSNKETYLEPKHNTLYKIRENGEEITIYVVDRSFVEKSDVIVYYNVQGEQRVYNTVQPAVQLNQKVQQLQSDDDPEEETFGCNITTITAERDEPHENQRPSSNTLDGSSPLEIQFFSNPVGDVRTFEWNIYQDDELLLARSEQDIDFTFEHSGKYLVHLKVTNDDKSASDSIYVTVSESQLMVPAVFTPNGDGINDEFRVAYTSLKDFSGTVMNRWGRVVFSWTNPQKGWDGNIAGKPAPEGTYFYIIRAIGSDNKEYKLKGHINLLR